MMNLQTLLGTELPIIQAPMAGVQGSALAVAVSNAGGLGSLPCAMLAADAMRQNWALMPPASPLRLRDSPLAPRRPICWPNSRRRW